MRENRGGRGEARGLPCRKPRLSSQNLAFCPHALQGPTQAKEDTAGGAGAGGDTGWLGPGTLIPPGCPGRSVSRTSVEPGVDPSWVSSGSCLLQVAPSTSSQRRCPGTSAGPCAPQQRRKGTVRGGLLHDRRDVHGFTRGPAFPSAESFPRPPISPQAHPTMPVYTKATASSFLY